MPAVSPIEPDVLAELNAAAPAGAQLFGRTPDEPPAELVGAIDGYLRSRRADADAVESADIINLGALLGEQYVRAFGWRWVDLVYPDDDTAFAVVDPDDSVGVQPMNWIYSIVHEGSPGNLLLNFNMVADGSAPHGQPGDPQMFH